VSDSSRQFPPNLLEDALRTIANALTDVVPADAQIHLLNAQRELLLAVAVIIEHNRARASGRPRPRGGATRPSRVELD
jgi:hypothetical protein